MNAAFLIRAATKASVRFGVRALGALALAVSATGATHAAEVDPAPRPAGTAIEDFFRNPDIGAAKLSPSGKWLAITTSTKTSRVFLAVVSVGDDHAPTVLANYSEADVRSFDWVNDERLVFNTIDTESPLNDQRFGPGLYSIRRDGKELRTLIRPVWMPQITGSDAGLPYLSPNHVMLRTVDDGSDDVIVGQYRFSAAGELESITPKRLDVTTGRAVALSAGAPPHVKDWVFDRSGRPRVAIALDRGQEEVFWRAEGRDAWTSIARFPSLRPAFVPLYVDRDSRLYVDAPSADGHAQLKRFDFGTGEPEADPIIDAPGFDLDPSPFVERTSGRLLGVAYETDARSVAWFDADFKRVQKIIDDRLPGHTNELICRPCRPDGTLLILSRSDQDPGTYYLYDVAKNAWETIGKVRKPIDPSRMAQLDFHRARARDGEDLPIWVTMPAGKSASPGPAVVLVHGGPWVRGGHWQWSPDAQFLASRGYVVIEPEFRGSDGFGRTHLEKGFRQWGLAMQDDVEDAVKWASDHNMIDPKRVCIAGASYGGYATLMGLVRHPDTYRCGVAWVAVTDPRLLFENSWLSDISQEAIEYSLPVMVGDPVSDAALLKDAAPVTHAKEIRVPLLMAFGEKDVRVPLEHGTSMRDAMRSAGLHPEFVVYQGEGHGFLKVQNRIDFWTRVEKFLDANLR